eukprot:sb/3474105/
MLQVADFGLSKGLLMTEYYRKLGGQVPIRWMAPESIKYGRYEQPIRTRHLGHVTNYQPIRDQYVGSRLRYMCTTRGQADRVERNAAIHSMSSYEGETRELVLLREETVVAGHIIELSFTMKGGLVQTLSRLNKTLSYEQGTG